MMSYERILYVISYCLNSLQDLLCVQDFCTITNLTDFNVFDAFRTGVSNLPEVGHYTPEFSSNLN